MAARRTGVDPDELRQVLTQLQGIELELMALRREQELLRAELTGLRSLLERDQPGPDERPPDPGRPGAEGPTDPAR